MNGMQNLSCDLFPHAEVPKFNYRYGRFYDAPISCLEHMEKMRISRDAVLNWLPLPIFEKTILDGFVRVSPGRTSTVGQIAQIIGVVKGPEAYNISGVVTDCMVTLKKYDGKPDTVPFSYISNKRFSRAEFDYWRRQCKAYNTIIPCLGAALKKQKDIEYANKAEQSTLSEIIDEESEKASAAMDFMQSIEKVKNWQMQNMTQSGNLWDTKENFIVPETAKEKSAACVKRSTKLDITDKKLKDYMDIICARRAEKEQSYQKRLQTNSEMPDHMNPMIRRYVGTHNPVPQVNPYEITAKKLDEGSTNCSVEYKEKLKRSFEELNDFEIDINIDLTALPGGSQGLAINGSKKTSPGSSGLEKIVSEDGTVGKEE